MQQLLGEPEIGGVFPNTNPDLRVMVAGGYRDDPQFETLPIIGWRTDDQDLHSAEAIVANAMDLQGREYVVREGSTGSCWGYDFNGGTEKAKEYLAADLPLDPRHTSTNQRN
jgi:hypothetical protein